MGAIQGAVNSALGTVAGSLVAGKHLKDQAAIKKSAETQELATLPAGIAKAEEELGGLEDEAKKATAGLEIAKAGGQMVGWDAEEGTAQSVYPDMSPEAKSYNIEKASRALNTATANLEAKKLLIEGFKQRLKELGGQR